MYLLVNLLIKISMF